MFGRSRIVASRPRWPAIIEGPMNSRLYEEILQQNVSASVGGLKLKRRTTTMIQSPGINEQQSGSNSWNPILLNDQVGGLTSDLLKRCCAVISSRPFKRDMANIYISQNSLLFREVAWNACQVLSRPDHALQKANNFSLAVSFWMFVKLWFQENVSKMSLQHLNKIRSGNNFVWAIHESILHENDHNEAVRCELRLLRWSWLVL